MTSKWAVYLLCFPEPGEHPDHYVGITTPNRLPARMREHRQGRGSKRTKAACEAGETWFHTQTWFTNCRCLEGRLQRYANVTELCPRCTQGLTFAPIRPYPKGGPLPRGGPWGFTD